MSVKDIIQDTFIHDQVLFKTAADRHTIQDIQNNEIRDINVTRNINKIRRQCAALDSTGDRLRTDR